MKTDSRVKVMTKNGTMGREYSMNKINWVFILSLLIWTPAQCLAENIEVNIPVGEYNINYVDGKSEVSVEGFGYVNVPGAPRLPSRIFAVAVPPGAEIQGVKVKSKQTVEFPGQYEVKAVPVYRVIGEENPEIYAEELERYRMTKERIYGSNDLYPSGLAEFIGQAGYRKYNLADVRITPFQYNPVSGKLYYFPEISIEVEYVLPGKNDDMREPVLYDCQPRMESQARLIMLNYDQAQEWYPKCSSGKGLYDYVIITTEALRPSIGSLVDWESDKGRNVRVVTVNWIESNYAGADTAQKMRNFLLEKYPTSEWGIEDVCFVGHHSDVPMRTVWQDAGYGRPRTDFYFAELSAPDDQSWDSNSNGRYGDDSDNVDFYSEINVGRIPWSDADTVEHICEKSEAYELNDDPAFKKNILLLGAYFWDDTDNAVLMEAKVDQPWMADWTMTRMYEQNGSYYSSYPCDYELLQSNVVSVWSSGSYAFVNWAGHGSYYGCYILGMGSAPFIEASDCSSLNDEYPAIIFADACSNSDTDYTNIGAKMLQQGAVGFVGATKVAYGTSAWDDPLDGSSQSMDYYFSTAVTSGEYTQGAAHQNALMQVYQIDGWYYPKFEMAEWTIWGNPDLGMGTILSSDGTIGLDKNIYSPGSQAVVSVRDVDLDENSGMPDTVEITLTTFTGDQETLVLNETGFSSCFFEGEITLEEGTATAGNGILEVQHNDAVTATYIDADDGHGGIDVEKSAMASVDAVAPEITGVEVTNITESEITIQWSTDEEATSTVVYGEGTPSQTKTSDMLSTFHEITITELNECTTYVFYVESADLAGNVATDDNQGSNYAEGTYEEVILMEEDMSVQPNWVVSGGAWAWGQPNGYGGQHGGPDPVSGHTGFNVYGYNLNGDYTNYMPEHYLTTDAIDCSGREGVKLSFQRWLGVERSTYDHAYIRVSNDGSFWHTIWENPDDELADEEWTYQEFDISDYADDQETVYIRWVMGDTDQGWVYCGWNIDDVKVSYSRECLLPTPTIAPSPTVGPTRTPTVDPTPDHISDYKVVLNMPSDYYTPGDTCRLDAELYNYSGVPMSNVPFFVILDIGGELWFYDDWKNDFDFKMIYLPIGKSILQILTEFEWPETGQTELNGIHFWSAMTTQDFQQVLGGMLAIGQWTFGFGP